MGHSAFLWTILFLACMSYVHCQYYDIFQAFQPYVQPQPSQPLNFLNDYTTRRPRPKQKVAVNENVRKLDKISITDINDDNNNARKVDERDKNKQARRKTTALFDFNFLTTPRPRKTKTKNQNRQETNKQSAITFIDDSRSDNRPNSRENENRPKSRPNNRKPQNQPASYESSWNDGRNSVYTTRPPYYETTKNYNTQNSRNKNYYTTHNPLLNRPGVKPAIVHGPPITNRPVQRPITQRPVTQRTTQRPVTQRATQRPSFEQRPQVITLDDDLTVTPEVISGPDEDYMSAIEKKRYIEIAERMCDKYKSLNTKQVQAIPLVPSPQPVRVNVSSCPPTTIPLVVGGKVVTVQEFPHMVILGWRKTKSRGYSWKCGGSLLSNQFILTAGHCAYQERDDNVISGPPRIVQLGSSYLNDPKAVFMKVASVTRHPKYKLPKAYYDLAIVKMVGTVTFSDVIKPACLGTPPAANRPVIATGWGKTEFASQSQELRSVSVPVWDISECHNALGVSMKLPYGPSSDSQLCAGDRSGGKDTCQGDSGGPAQIQDGCIWRVVAVTSVGRFCGAADTPAIYATVQKAFISAVVFKDQYKNNDNNNNRDQTTISFDWNKQGNIPVNNHQNFNRESGSEWNRQNNRDTNYGINGERNNGETYNSPKQSNRETNNGNRGNNGETYNWSTERNNNYNQASNTYNSQNQQNRNEFNYNNYNIQTTESYSNSNSRRDDSYPSRETENVAKEFYNNYAGSNNFNNYNRQVTNGGETYNNANVWWT